MRPMHCNKSHCYVIQFPDGLTKIGVSHDPEGRVKSVEKEFDKTAVGFIVFEPVEHDNAYRVEKHFKDRNRNRKAFREFYHMPFEQAKSEMEHLLNLERGGYKYPLYISPDNAAWLTVWLTNEQFDFVSKKAKEMDVSKSEYLGNEISFALENGTPEIMENVTTNARNIDFRVSRETKRKVDSIANGTPLNMNVILLSILRNATGTTLLTRNFGLDKAQ